MGGGDAAEGVGRHMFGDEALERGGVEDRVRGVEGAFKYIFVSNGGVNLAQGGIILFFAEEGEGGDEGAGADAGDDVEFGAARGGVAPATEDTAAEGTIGIPSGENEDVFRRVVGKGGAEIGLEFLIAVEGDLLGKGA